MDAHSFSSFVNRSVFGLRELRTYLLFSVSVLAVSAFAGYVLTEVYVGVADTALEGVVQAIAPLGHLTPIMFALFIFANNSITALIASLGGIAGALLPVVILAVNGFLIGVVYSLTVSEEGALFFFKGIAPHGVIELPAILYATSIGVFLGMKSMRAVIKKKRRRRALNRVRRDIRRAVYSLVLIIIPLLLIAAFVETCVTPHVLHEGVVMISCST